MANTDPILDTRMYDVEFPNGEVSEYSANVIAENMFTQCDMERKQFAMLSSLANHKKDGHAVEVADGFVQRGNNRHRRITTQDWKICVEWRDGSTTWERLTNLKEAYPIEVAESATSRGLTHEPAFSW